MTDSHRIILILLILLITAVTLSPCLNNDFTNWDDNKYVTENPDIKSLNLENIKKIFASQYVAMYLPVTMLSYSLNYYFFGLNPCAYHTTDLIIHLLNCILVFYLFLLLSENTLSSFIIAILFGIHPLHVESVAWISERKDVLCCLFFLAGLISYIHYKKREKKLFYIMSLIAFILSLMSKTMSITLPLLLILTDRFFYNKTGNSRVEKIPFFLISALFGIIALFTQTEAMEKHSSFTFLDNLCIASYGILFYLYKMIWPLNLSAIYPYPEKTGYFLQIKFLISPLILIIPTATVIFSGKYTKKIIFGSLFFLITILPVIKLVPIGDAMTADRYTYIPLLGIFYILGEGFSFLYTFYNRNKDYGRIIKSSLAVLLIAVIITLSWLSYNRCYIWKDSITLWSDVIKNYPSVTPAYINRGFAYYNKGDFDNSLKDYTEAIKLEPELAQLYNDRGNAYDMKGEEDRALADYTKAISLDPAFLPAYYNRGIIYDRKGNYDEALSDYTKALEINSDSTEVYYMRAFSYYKKGEYSKAIKDFTKTIENKPASGEAYYNRALCYYSIGEYDSAWQDTKKAIELGYEIDPAFIEALKKFIDKP